MTTVLTASLVWPHITASSVVDILLVAILIYQFLVLVRGTRAAPMLMGLAVLGLAFYFARLGDLRTLNWLLSTLLPYVVFALIVVFQSEIRHALANLGSRILRSRSSDSAADAYDDIVMAANLFSQNQTGAPTSKAVCHWTRGFRTIFWRPCSAPALHCMTERSSCNATGSRRRLASCRCP
jgi:DNA integrity scanning protein DisA with diadenylate cyclase activity